MTFSSIPFLNVFVTKKGKRMRVKKAELRKRLPQLPINYPGPDVIPFDYEKEKSKVENLCKRLADNEVEVRDAVLSEIPAYIKEVSNRYINRPKPATDAGKETKRRLTRMERLERRIAEQKKLFLGVDEDELSLLFSKLSLGLFFCMWHSDKPLTQLSCAAEISRLIHYPVTADHCLLFLRCFLRVLSRKWTSIDQWRVDKYMSLVRKVLFESLRLISYQMKLLGGAGAPVHIEGAKGTSRKRTRPDAGAEKKDESAAVANSDDAAAAETGGDSANGAQTEYQRLLKEWIDVYQREIIMGSARGLAMHLADIFLDEILRAKITDPATFVALCQGIPISIMQEGSKLERRVVDYFFAGIASGRLEQVVDPALTDPQRGAAANAVEEKKAVERQQWSLAMAGHLATCAKVASRSTETKYEIRSLFSECQLTLENYITQRKAPEQFEPENEKDLKLRLAKEVAAAAAAKASREEVVQKKIAKKHSMHRQKVKMGLVKQKGKTRRKK
jgi:hypothetical protein